MSDPLNIGQAFFEMTARMMANPAQLVAGADDAVAGPHDAVADAPRAHAGRAGGAGDRARAPTTAASRTRLAEESYVFDFIKQSYLLTARWLQSTGREVEGLDDKTAQKVDFYTRQFVDAMAPSNFAVTNPEVLRATLESGGENLVRGLRNLLDDLERGKGKLTIKMTDLKPSRSARTSPPRPARSCSRTS